MTTIAPLEDRDLRKALALFDVGLGAGYVRLEDLSSPLWMALGAWRDGRLVGARLHKAGPLDDLVAAKAHESVRAELLGLLAVPPGCRTAGVLHTIVVDPAASGSGVGSALTRQAVADLTEAGATFIFSLAWTDETGTHAAKMLERAGLARVGRLERPWEGASIEQGFVCPSDGWPCRCSAQVYAWRR